MKNPVQRKGLENIKTTIKKGVNHEKEIQMSRMRLCLRR